jgi:glycosyltransferase involved in cell wall biosynthesis
MLKADKKYSFVITAYNSEQYIAGCIQAALNQDYPNIEVIVLDDGSTDMTGKICLSIKDPRFRYIRSKRLGRCRALNEAISHAEGEFIAINDADDLSLPWRIRYAAKFFDQYPDLAYIATNFFRTDHFKATVPDDLKSINPESDYEPVIWPSRIAVYRRNLFNHSTLVFPKSVWEESGGYDESLVVNEDYDFYLRALKFGRAALLPGKTVLWYSNPYGFFKSITIKAYLKDMDRIKKRAFDLLELPFWMKPYYPFWVKIYKTVNFYRRLQMSLKPSKILRS